MISELTMLTFVSRAACYVLCVAEGWSLLVVTISRNLSSQISEKQPQESKWVPHAFGSSVVTRITCECAGLPRVAAEGPSFSAERSAGQCPARRPCLEGSTCLWLRMLQGWWPIHSMRPTDPTRIFQPHPYPWAPGSDLRTLLDKHLSQRRKA